MSDKIFKVGDKVYCHEDGIRGIVRAVYNAMNWGTVIDVTPFQGKVIYASPIKKWKVIKHE